MQMSEPRHVKTLVSGISIDGRIYPKGSVILTDGYRRKELVEVHKHAEDHPGPAVEAEPEEDDVITHGDQTNRQTKPERATKR